MASIPCSISSAPAVAERVKKKKSPVCRICKRAIDSPRDVPFPFCSDRCKQIDLGNWLDGRYAMPAHDEPPEEEEEERQ